MANARQTYEALNVGNLLWLDPNKVEVVGHDDDDNGTHKLSDPRIAKHLKYLRSADGRRFIDSLKKHGNIDPVTVVKEGNRVLIARGRKRLLGLRIANEELAAEGGHAMRLQAISVANMGLAQAVAGIDNSYHTEETPLEKARRAEGYRVGGYSEEDIGIFLDASRGTLANWAKMLKCAPALVKAAEKGEVSYTLLYGDMCEKSEEEQTAALAAAPSSEAEKPTTKRERTRAVRGAANGEKSARWSAAQVRALHVAIAPTEEQPFGDGDENVALVWGVLSVILGEDEKMAGLSEYADVKAIIRKVLKAGEE